MSEKPILFNGEMVRAILDGRKTQTRRVMKPQPKKIHGLYCFFKGKSPYAKFSYQTLANFKKRAIAECSPYGQKGDQLWVRETWRAYGDRGGLLRDQELAHCTGPRDVMFKATADEAEIALFDFRPSIFMPRWASRIQLSIKDIRVERLQDISEEDAQAEGCSAEWGNVSAPMEPPEYDGHSARDDFHALWDSINAKRGYEWDSNPFVWVVDFEVLK